LTFQNPTDLLSSCKQSCAGRYAESICLRQHFSHCKKTLGEKTDRDQSYDYKDRFFERVNEQVKHSNI